MSALRFAYADPPYFGCAAKFYGKLHPLAAVYDTVEGHQALVDRLANEYPDGWALSMTSGNLLDLVPNLALPAGVRVAAWVKPFHIFKKGVRPAYAWEPVLFVGGRNKNHPPPLKGGKATTPRDWIAANITLRKGLTGAKPPAFNQWIMDLLGYRSGDLLDDLFPGTGGMAAALSAVDEEAS